MEAAVRDLHPLWIEEPVLPELTEELAVCARKFRTPIAAGERWFTRWGFKPFLDRCLVAIVQPDVSNAGGVSELVKIAAMAEVSGAAFNPHNPNGPVRSQTSLHLAAYAQAFQLLEHRMEGLDFMRRIASAVPEVEADDCCSLPQGPGLGVELREGEITLHPRRTWIPESFRGDGSVAGW